MAHTCAVNLRNPTIAVLMFQQTYKTLAAHATLPEILILYLLFFSLSRKRKQFPAGSNKAYVHLEGIHHLNSRETSTAGHSPLPMSAKATGPTPPASNRLPRPLPGHQSTLWGAYPRCAFRYMVATREPFRPNSHRVYMLCAPPTAT
jgi:hypothetical protein